MKHIKLYIALALPILAWAATPAELMDHYVAGLTETIQALESIKDAPGAKQAVPRLEAAIAHVESARLALVAANLNAQNPEHKSALDQKAAAIQQAMAKLHNELVRVKASRAVRSEIHESLRKLKEAGEPEKLP